MRKLDLDRFLQVENLRSHPDFMTVLNSLSLGGRGKFTNDSVKRKKRLQRLRSQANRIRTDEYSSQSAVPYRLAIARSFISTWKKFLNFTHGIFASLKWFFRNFTFFIQIKVIRMPINVGLLIIVNDRIRMFAEKPKPPPSDMAMFFLSCHRFRLQRFSRNID